MTGLVDITEKPEVFRRAKASGIIKLRASTIDAIKLGQVKKGDVLTTAKLAGILAVKDTPRLITMCHNIPITDISVEFCLQPDSITSIVIVSSVSKTGVEMEALAGVTAALLNIWDMVKYLEKDDSGNYPATKIDEIRVIKKEKRDMMKI
ncbi:MAG: cyclic pyranopterin monophosphate synthase MoaC [Methanotrichaceae archaeon]|nr:cyclic pyranopterin monophosphate synthase MoaC [Methanotrichaceae archaeon]